MPRPLSFGYDGDGGLGDRLLFYVEKTATTSLAVEYLSGEPLPHVGERLTLTDGQGGERGTVETTRVAIIPLGLLGDWRETIELIRADAGDPAWELRDSEPVVVEWFRLLEPERHASESSCKPIESEVATNGYV